jgi:hypothetical protein
VEARVEAPLEIMIKGKLLKQAIDKFMTSPTAQEARVQIVLPNGEFYDISGIKL